MKNKKKFNNNAFGSAPVGLTSNVNIKIVEKGTNRLVAERDLHNMATHAMTQGILEFLKGSFTGSVITKDTTNVQRAWDFIPCYVAVGNAGVTTTVNSDGEPKFASYTPPIAPSFHDMKLVRELSYTVDGESNPIAEDTGIPIGRMRDTVNANNTESVSVVLQAQFDISELIAHDYGTLNQKYYEDSYVVERDWKPYDSVSSTEKRRGNLITELALYSGKRKDGGTMLARVVLDCTQYIDETDPDNPKSTLDEQGYPIDIDDVEKRNKIPVFKTDRDYMVVTWRLSIISVDPSKKPQVEPSDKFLSKIAVFPAGLFKNANLSSLGETITLDLPLCEESIVDSNIVNAPFLNSTFVDDATLIVNIPKMTIADNMLAGFGSNAPLVIVNGEDTLTSMHNMFRNNLITYQPKVIILNLSTENVTDFTCAFGTTAPASSGGIAEIEEIIGNLNLTSATTVENMFRRCTNLETVTFEPHTIKIDISFGDCSSLSVDSLISIANGLDETASDKTITFTKDIVDNILPTIMGSVTLDMESHQHFFETDKPVKNTSLLNFITSSKDWSVASPDSSSEA